MSSINNQQDNAESLRSVYDDPYGDGEKETFESDTRQKGYKRGTDVEKMH